MSRAVLLPSAKQRYATAATHPWLKPLLLGAVLGALVVQALHAVTGGRSASSAEPSLRESVYALGNVWPNSHTTRNEDGLVCEACERAIAQKEVELARLRDRVRDVSKENLKMLEEIDFAREGGSDRDGGGDGERDGGGEREGDGDGDGDGEDGATTSTTSAISRTGKHNGKERKQITVFVGIQTGYSPDAPPGGNYNYADRRKAIRETVRRRCDSLVDDGCRVASLPSRACSLSHAPVLCSSVVSVRGCGVHEKAGGGRDRCQVRDRVGQDCAGEGGVCVGAAAARRFSGPPDRGRLS